MTSSKIKQLDLLTIIYKSASGHSDLISGISSSPVFPGRGASRSSAFTRVFDALWVQRRSGIVPDSASVKVPVQQRSIHAALRPGHIRNCCSTLFSRRARR
jgi:hypothetical protein